MQNGLSKKNTVKLYCTLIVYLTAHLSGNTVVVKPPNPHPVPKLVDLYKPWVFARASEASTLFIEPHFKGSEPYAHLIKQEKVLHWFEYDGKQSHLWKVTKYTEDDKELTLFLEGGAKVVVFPYWDIDHCLLIIRFDPSLEENPTRFSVPYQHLKGIPYLEGE